MSDEGPWGKSNDSSGKARPSSSHEPQDVLGTLKRFFDAKKQGRKKNGGSAGNPSGNLGGFFPKGLLFLLVPLFLAVPFLFYRVNPGEQALVLRFGELVRTSPPGLHLRFPWPLEDVIVKSITSVNRISSEFLFADRRRYYNRNSEGSDADQNVMLTGDENLVEAHFTVLWVIKNLKSYVFNARNPEETLRSLAESVVRDIVAQTPIATILAEGRALINDKAQMQLQNIADQYGLGIRVQEVMMGRIDPPSIVIDAYRDVQRARADQERMVNDAQGYSYRYIFNKSAEAKRLTQTAQGEAARLVAEAKSKTYPFLQVLEEYRQSPKTVRSQMLIQSLSDLLAHRKKIVVTGKGAPPVMIFSDGSSATSCPAALKVSAQQIASHHAGSGGNPSNISEETKEGERS